MPLPAKEESSRSDDDRSIGSGRREPPKEISLTDPQAAWVARKSTDPFFAYDANYLIDNKAGIIVDAEGTRANRIAEIAITETMIERVKSRFDLRLRRRHCLWRGQVCSNGWSIEAPDAVRVGLESGPTSTWLWIETPSHPWHLALVAARSRRRGASRGGHQYS